MYIHNIAIKTPLYQTFSYVWHEQIPLGCRVVVHFAHREVVGVVWSYESTSFADMTYTVKEIINVLDDTSLFTEHLRASINFAAEYYLQPIGELVFAALPNALKKPISIPTLPSSTGKPSELDPLTLRSEQQQAVDQIAQSLGEYHGYLLHGVTGSGKTEVYLELAQKVIESGKQVLVLVPEIGLTPQMISRFSKRLGYVVATVHSGLTPKQQLKSFIQAQRGKCDIILGTRSALWCNFKDLGLIVIDEEHDTSYKQHSAPRYNAKHMAFVLAKQWDIPIVCGSATPSTDILKSLIDGKITRITLEERIGNTLPEVEIINISTEQAILSLELTEAIKAELSSHKQVMLFINRRGYAPLYYCTSCGAKAMCTHCDIELVYHLDSHSLKCHECGARYSVTQHCSECGEPTMTMLGYGTQRIEEQLIATFKNTDIIRIDSDTNTNKTQFKHKLERISSGKECIIIGTQILAKGHDFKNINLVGVLDVDYGLLSYNFRATEELMQLLIQVTGRAGRSFEADTPRVLIQTRYPNNELFQYVKHHNYSLFVKKLLTQRKKALMPPFSSRALLVANAPVADTARQYLIKVKELLDSLQLNILVSLVTEGAIYKKANHYYYEINIFSDSFSVLHHALHTLLAHQPKLPHKVRFFIDIDPL